MTATPPVIDVATLPYYAKPTDHHDYVWKGIEYPRVTSILGCIGKDVLYNWYAKMAAVECSELIEKAEAGFFTQLVANEKIKNWQHTMTAAIRYRDHKGRIGSIAHHYLYERAMGIPMNDLRVWIFQTIDALQLVKREETGDDYASTLAQAVEPYIYVIDEWLSKFDPSWEAVGQEACVVNTEYGFAGTCDAIANFTRDKWPKDLTWNFEKQEVRLLMDFKTSKQLSDMFFWQIEAYRHAEFIGLVHDGSEEELPVTDGSMILHIKPDSGVQTITCVPNEHIWEAFVSLVHVYNTLNLKVSSQKVKKISQARAKTTKNGGPRECPF
jgi:hypothetical protein